jgi:hypothetical protein
MLSKNGLLQQLAKLLIERALSGDSTNKLGYEKRGAAAAPAAVQKRNQPENAQKRECL